MDRKISLSQYRWMDVGTLTVLMVFAELLIFLAVSQWFPEQLFTVSPIGAIVTLVMMRWGFEAAVPAAVGGLLYSVLYGGNGSQILIYTLGNLLAMVMVPVFRKIGKEKIRSEKFIGIMLALGVSVLMQIGRGLAALLFGGTMGTLLRFITTGVLSDIFTMIVIWITYQVDGLFEDQKHYLLRIQKEQEERGKQS